MYRRLSKSRRLKKYDSGVDVTLPTPSKSDSPNAVLSRVNRRPVLASIPVKDPPISRLDTDSPLLSPRAINGESFSPRSKLPPIRSPSRTSEKSLPPSVSPFSEDLLGFKIRSDYQFGSGRMYLAVPNVALDDPGIKEPSDGLARSASVTSLRTADAYIRESTQLIHLNDDGYTRLNQYLLKHEIGRGSYGVVKLATTSDDGRNYAMKIMSKKKLLKRAALARRASKVRNQADVNPLARLYREIAILKKLQHPNVVSLVEVLDDPNEDDLYLVFELLPKGEVLFIPTTQPLEERVAWSYFRDVASGLEYLHYQKICHRDIKPANLLLDDNNRVKIADFGVSSEFTGQDCFLTSTMGTPVFLGGTIAFAAPELLEPQESRHLSGRAADIWSLGVTLYCFVTGNVPWRDQTLVGIHQRITTEPLTFPNAFDLSTELIEFIQMLLTIDPDKRITLPEIKENTWVTHGGTQPLPRTEENCIQITVSEEEIENAVKHVARLAPLILVKGMLKNKSFRNPYRRLSGSQFKSSVSQQDLKNETLASTLKEKEPAAKLTTDNTNDTQELTAENLPT